MRGIPKKIYEQIRSNPDYGYCWRRHTLHDHQCRGRITLEHAIIYKGQQVNEVWAIIPICAYAHSVDQWQDSGILNKEINEWIAFSSLVRLPKSELVLQIRKYRMVNWLQKLEYLTEKYGDFSLSTTKSVRIL